MKIKFKEFGENKKTSRNISGKCLRPIVENKKEIERRIFGATDFARLPRPMLMVVGSRAEGTCELRSDIDIQLIFHPKELQERQKRADITITETGIKDYLELVLGYRGEKAINDLDLDIFVTWDGVLAKWKGVEWKPSGWINL